MEDEIAREEKSRSRIVDTLEYPSCVTSNCGHPAPGASPNCYSHKSPAERQEYLRVVVMESAPLVVSGATLTAGDLHEIFSSMSTTYEDNQWYRCVPGASYFEDCTFEVDRLYIPEGKFVGLAFLGTVSFQRATFKMGLQWADVSCKRDLVFSSAKFWGGAHLGDASFPGAVQLDGVDVRGICDLSRAVIGGGLTTSYMKSVGFDLDGATVEGEAGFTASNFDAFPDARPPNTSIEVRLAGASLSMNAYFDGVTFPPRVQLGPEYGRPPAKVAATVFMSSCVFGSVDKAGTFDFRGVEFSLLHFDGNTVHGSLDFTKATFHAGLSIDHLTVRGKRYEPDFASLTPYYGLVGLIFEGSVFNSGLRLKKVKCEGIVSLDKVQVSGEMSMTDLSVHGSISVRDASLPYLAVSADSADFSMVRCHFDKGALLTLNSRRVSLIECTAAERLRISRRDSEAVARVVSLSHTDVSKLSVSNVDLSAVRLGDAINLDKLEMLGETEFLAVASKMRAKRRILLDEVEARDLSSEARSNRAKEVAATYRELRKGREDRKDEPGGGDFYYGEMEMRKLSARSFSIDRFLFLSYWAISGYGLRASRALFAGLVATFAAALFLRLQADNRFGGYWQNLIGFLQVSLGLDKIPSGLAIGTSIVFILGRLAVPGALALAALAIRGRVKR